ncbi:MAG: hypothetical protein P8045_04715 [Candidatus Thiodiazotropha sp.]
MQHFKHSKTPLMATIALTCSIAGFSAASQADYKTFVPSPDQPYLFEDGKVDFGTYNGFRRYHADCHVCIADN